MKNKNEIIPWVDEIMNSIDGIGKVPANTFLYAKIQHRMAGNVNEGVVGKWIYNVAIMLFALLILNIYAFASLNNSRSARNDKGAGIEAFSTEYNLNLNSDNL